MESVENPSLYYRENIGGLISVLEAMSQANVKKIVYSSSCSVYGNSVEEKVNENSETNPQSPYGETKLVGELLLKADEKARGIRWVSLRYFNVAGCGNSDLGDTGVFNLIPMVFRALDNKQRPQVFGDDYETKDGSCIRDYIHVMDLAEAHLLALDGLRSKQISNIYNIGNNVGFSVKEIIEIAEEVTQRKIKINIESRRKGDPAQLVANNKKIKEELNWTAQYSDLKTIISSAWQWEQKLLQSN